MESIPKYMSSIFLLILQIEAPRKVTIKDEDIQVQDFIIKDDTGKISTTLWKKDHGSELTAGSYVEVTDLKVSVFKNQTVLNSTDETKIMVSFTFLR